MNKWLQRLAVAASVGMYIVMLQGALVTNTGSRYGCGRSWPLCHGRFIPEYALETMIEFGHRSVSGIVGVLVILLAVWCWRVLRHRPTVRALAVVGVFFLLLQAALGALVVLIPQPKWILAGHFGISLIAFGSTLLLAVHVFQAGGSAASLPPVGPRLRRWAWQVLAYLMVVVYTGAYVRHTSSDLACGLDFPLCNGQVLPPLAGPVGIHFAHRLAAAGALVMVARLFYLAWQERQARPDVYRAAAGALALVLAQAAAGAVVVLSGLSLLARMAHATFITGLFGVLCYLCLQVYRPAPAAAATPLAGD